MNAAPGERTRRPPVKVLSAQLRAAETRGAADDADAAAAEGGGHVLRLDGGRRTLPVSLVWMQGTVLEAPPDRNTALLVDESGTFAVSGVSGVPRGKPCLSAGKYVMVMGVVQAVSPEPLIRAVKMADLSEQAEIHRRMWKLEVDELQQLLA